MTKIDRDWLEALPYAAVGATKGVLEQVPGVVAWAALVSSVASYDMWAVRNDKQTLTAAFHEGLEHPIMKFVCIGALGATALHLAKVLPKQLDPFYISVQR